MMGDATIRLENIAQKSGEFSPGLIFLEPALQVVLAAADGVMAPASAGSGVLGVRKRTCGIPVAYGPVIGPVLCSKRRSGTRDGAPAPSTVPPLTEGNDKLKETIWPPFRPRP